MGLNLLAIAALAAAVAGTILQTCRVPNTTVESAPFNLRSSLNVNITAEEELLVAGLPKDALEARCDRQYNGETYFFLSNDTLNLYTPTNIIQETFVNLNELDHPELGLPYGVLLIQYSTTPGGWEPGPNTTRHGWSLVKGQLDGEEAEFIKWRGQDLMSCDPPDPRDEGEDNLKPFLITVGIEDAEKDPEFGEVCQHFRLRAALSDKPNACTYWFWPNSDENDF